GHHLPAPLHDRRGLDVDLHLLGDRGAVVGAPEVNRLVAARRGDAEVVLGAAPVLALPPVRDSGLAVRLLRPVLDRHGGSVAAGEGPDHHGEDRDREQHGAGHDRLSFSRPPLCYGKNLMSDVRIDKWLWAARFFKSRTLAATACAGGKVHVNGDSIKASRTVRPGDLLQITLPRGRRIVRVAVLTERRGSGGDAALLYEDLTPPPPPRESRPRPPPPPRRNPRPGPPAYRPPGAGRPTKRQRRDIDRLSRW